MWGSHLSSALGKTLAKPMYKAHLQKLGSSVSGRYVIEQATMVLRMVGAGNTSRLSSKADCCQGGALTTSGRFTSCNFCLDGC